MPSDLFNPQYKLDYYRKNFYTRRTFNYGKLKYQILFGGVVSYLYTDSDYLKNDFNSRPDLNHSRKIGDKVTDEERKVFEMFDGDYFGQQFDHAPQSWVKKFKKFFYPSVDYNPEPSYYLPFYNYKKSYFPDTLGNYYTS